MFGPCNIPLLVIQFAAAFGLEYLAWWVARARIDGVVAAERTTGCVIVEAIIQVCAFYVLVDQSEWLARIAVGAATVAGAAAGWDSTAKNPLRTMGKGPR